MKFTKMVKSTVVAAVVAGAMLLAPSSANAGVFFSVGIAPPAIPVYDQPLAPGYGYIWTPGYWAYGDNGYYWVDGAWVLPPYSEALWTPGYWGWGDSGYFWNAGYWGRNIGYYGGINYGFGYFGTGFYGGYWNGGHFFYNRAYNHLGFRDHDAFVYNRRVEGFDGRPGGAAFARNEGGANRNGENFNRGAGVNGNTFANRGNENFNRGAGANGSAYANRGADNANRGNPAGSVSRPGYSGAETRSYNNGSAYAQRGGANSYAPPQSRSYNGGGQPQARSYNGGGGGQPQTHSYSGGGNAGGGGGFRGSGGGGESHGGGGGGRR